MADVLGDVVQWMEGLEPLWIYFTIFTISFLENVVPPIPGDMVIVFGGYLVGMGVIGFLPVVVLATVGGAVGFMTMYAIGWRFGAAVFDPDRLRWVPKQQAIRARDWLLRYGYLVVGANRFLSGLRSVISLAVGSARMEVVQTAAWATFSSGLWCLLIVYLGYFVGDRWELIGDYLEAYGRVVVTIAVVGLGVYLAQRSWREWRQTG